MKTHTSAIRRFAGSFALLGLGLAAPTGAGVVNSKIDLQTDKPIYSMRMGFGSNMPAIQHGIAHEQFNSGMGSEYCDQPNPGDSVQWKKLTGFATWSGLDWIRLYFEFNDFEPQKGVFTWDSENFLTLLRWLDWAEANGVDVQLQEQDVASTWNCMSGQDCGFSAPADLNEWAKGYATMVDYLVNKIGYKCIKTLNIINEPNPSWGWWRGRSVCEGYRAARPLLDAKGIKLPFVGTEAGEFDNCKDLLWAREDHEYNTCQKNPAVPAPRTTNDMTYASLWGEWGLGGTKDHEFDWNIRTSKWMIAGLGNKNDGYARWSYLNMNDVDGEFSAIQIWDPNKNMLLDEMKPQRNQYWTEGVVSRYTSKYSIVYPSSSDNGNLTTGYLKSPNGNTTLLAINIDYNNDAVTTVTFNNLKANTVLYRYTATPANVKDKDNVSMAWSKTFTLDGTNNKFVDTITANSIYAYSTYKLGPNDSGVIWDGDFRDANATPPIAQQPPPVRALPNHGAYPEDFDSTKIYRIASRTAKKFLEDAPKLADSSDTPKQHWKILNAGKGYYRVKNISSGQFLDNGGSKTDGASINQAAASSSENQLWEIIRVGNGYFKFHARGSLTITKGNQSKNRLYDNLANANGAVKQTKEANSSEQNWLIQALPTPVGIETSVPRFASFSGPSQLLSLNGSILRHFDESTSRRILAGERQILTGLPKGIYFLRNLASKSVSSVVKQND